MTFRPPGKLPASRLFVVGTTAAVLETQWWLLLEGRCLLKCSRRAASAVNKLPIHPSIAVVGLRYGQAAQLASRCGGVAKLKFVNADQSETVLPHADAIFLLTRFIEHRWTNASLRALPRRRVYLHGGGITTLSERILTLVATAIQA